MKQPNPAHLHRAQRRQLHKQQDFEFELYAVLCIHRHSPQGCYAIHSQHEVKAKGFHACHDYLCLHRYLSSGWPEADGADAIALELLAVHGGYASTTFFPSFAACMKLKLCTSCSQCPPSCCVAYHLHLHLRQRLIQWAQGKEAGAESSSLSTFPC
ncbi:hypothetical protein M514_26687 [Trichuris suis]|nr:hypothetical protein M514_26687 [Trichuris suis]